ncbi:MAG: hypothetical protein ACTS3F_09660 [Phycisphaerales bacterium]
MLWVLGIVVGVLGFPSGATAQRIEIGGQVEVRLDEATDVQAQESPAGADGSQSIMEPPLSLLVLRADGRIVVVSWLAVDESQVRFVDAATGQQSLAPRGEILGVFMGATGARGALGIGGLSSGLVRPLVPSARLAMRAAALDEGAARATDGLTLPGGYDTLGGSGDGEADEGAGETLRWTHPPTGLWSLPLDRVAWVWVGSIGGETLGVTGSSPAEAPSEDVLALSNGDRLSGFVVSMGDEVELETTDGAELLLPIERISGIRLANPAEPRRGVWVFTDSGAAFPLGGIVGASDTGWIGTPSDPSMGPYTHSQGGEPAAVRETIEVPMDQLAALILASDRIVALSTIEPQSVVGMAGDEGGSRGGELVEDRRHPLDLALPIGAPMDAMDLVLARVMEARWPLPGGSERFVATASLRDPRNPWAAATLSVLIDGREIERIELSPDRPAAAINAEARGRSMTLRVEPGAFGPVQNAVVLHRPLLIVEGEEAPGAGD